MQLSQGSGLFELMGLNTFEQKDFYKIYKPLLKISKQELQDYLDENKYNYFIDKSNFNQKYTRNYFRHNFSNKFLQKFQNGVINSFEYLQKDLNSMELKLQPLYEKYEFEVFENLKDDNLNIRVIDKSLKKRGFLISNAQRSEILDKKELTISHKVNIAITKDFIYIVPKVQVNMSKEFKEKCRIKKIPKNIRAYLFLNEINDMDFIE